MGKKYPKFDMSPYKMVSQMEFPLSDDIVRQSIYRQKCQWTSVKKSVDLVDDEFDLVIRMRTDLEFPDRVPLEACTGNGLYMMNGSYQAGAGREYCDWVLLWPTQTCSRILTHLKYLMTSMPMVFVTCMNL